MTSPLLSGRSLALSFGRTAALSGVDLDLAASEVVAVMGTSGSGKSTLLHCLAGILRPDSGEVLFAGERIDALSERERSALRRKDFGFVFQFGELVPELTLAENVALPLRLAGLSRRTAAVRAVEMLGRLEVDDVADKRASEVSGGQAQRVAVARALVHRPRVVFADEPTGALDSANGELVLDALCALARDLGSAVVLVTHEARVAAFADREIVMRNGRVVVGAVAQ
jgi:putative ABC transport system ATP-binding protein